MRRTQALFEGLNTLQEFLLAMALGDEVTAKRASEISGLGCARCEALLDALMQAGVMVRRQDAYVRCRLESAGRHFTPAAEPPARDGKAPVLLVDHA